MKRTVLALLVVGICLGSAHCRTLTQIAAAATTAPKGAAAAAEEPAAASQAAGPAALAGPAAATGAGPAAGTQPATAPVATGAAAGAAAEPTGPAGAGASVGPATKPAATAAAPPANEWVQRNGYIPLPDSITNPPPAAAKAPAALPPANAWGGFEAPAPEDPTGTMVYSDPKYAPQNVQAAMAAEDPNSVMLPQPPQQPQTGPNMGALGGNMPMGPTPTPAAAAGDSVFANAGGGFSNRYTPSVGNAIGSSDLIAKMIIDAPEQQVSASGDALRAMFANLTQTPVESIYVYQTRTINNANGQPSLDLSLLFKNTGDVDRTRQQNSLLHPDVAKVFINQVAQKTGLKIQPGTLKTSAGVNDGGAAAGAPGTMLPGAMPGMLPAAMPGALPGFGMNMTMPLATAAPVAPAAEPAAPPAKSAAGSSVWSIGLSAVALVAALAIV